MTDLTPSVQELLREKRKELATETEITQAPPRDPRNVNEFLKEAYRINSHIQSLLKYLQSIRHSYLSIHTSNKKKPEAPATTLNTTTNLPTQNLSDADRDSIDSSTALLLRDLSASISNLQSAEQLRQETERQLLHKRYGHLKGTGVLWRWAAGAETADEGKSDEQISAEESARYIRTVRENVLWFLRRNLEQVAEVQRAMVEKRIERVREKEKSVLYKVTIPQEQLQRQRQNRYERDEPAAGREQQQKYEKASMLSDQETATIESQLSAEQLQLFAEENAMMLRHYEDTLSKVQNAEKSLLEISSLQQTLVSHLSTQEELISQLVTDASTTAENVGKGNKELKRANERKSTAQMVFWCTAGLCVWLIVWDAIF